jgi:3'-phosphoadenosine 5'-phosphosulfate sulfotransferase (PAPS reductase)/FAD synthetase
MLWSIGKDSTVLLWLARKAFFGRVNSVADLSGKIVAVPQFGNTQHLNLLSILDAKSSKEA